MALRYLLDENLRPAYKAQIVRREPAIAVRVVGEVGAPPKGTADPEILRWCEAHGYVLVTNNRKSMPLHLAKHLQEGHTGMPYSSRSRTSDIGPSPVLA